MKNDTGYPLISGSDRILVNERFGGFPHQSAIGLMPPAPTPADGDSGAALLLAHERWHAKWIALRRRGVGASEVASINGVQGAYGSTFGLWWDKKVGLRVESGNEDVMVMGTRLETIIGEEWQARNPDALLVRPGAGLYGHPTAQWLMCTPDFLAIVRRGDDPWPSVEPVECKAYDGGKGWGTPGTDQVPPHIKVQGLMQCEVLGAERVHVARMQAKRVTLYTIEAYPRDDNGVRRALIHHWMTQAAVFVESLKGATPPPIDGSAATEATLAALHSNIEEGTRAMVTDDTARRYRQALRIVAEAKTNLLHIKNVMREAMRDAEFATDPDGNDIAQRRHYKRAGYVVPAAEIDGVWPVGDTS